MDKQQTKKKLKTYVESITQNSKGKNMYICPLCKSGTGKNKSGAFSLTKNEDQWKCFACGKGGDIFDLIGAIENIHEPSIQFKRAEEILSYKLNFTDSISQVKIKQKVTQKKEIAYTTFFLQAQQHINQTDYPQQRGLSKNIIKQFGLGFMKEWKHPNTPTASPSPRLIIPTSKYSYLARDIRKGLSKSQEGYSKQKVGSTSLFNLTALKTALNTIFIVEGEIDALSIMEVGKQAIALGSSNMADQLINHLKENKPTQTIVLLLDNDNAGNECSDKIKIALKQMGISFYQGKLPNQYKDPNEYLIQDREEFISFVTQLEQKAIEINDDRKQEYKKKSVVYHIQHFIDSIHNQTSTSYIPTGFYTLDELLDGGLYDALYIIGAISSLGKTTLVMQITDQIAMHGQDVLIFSLEMARTELIAKSISRHTLQRILTYGGNITHAKTARGITTGTRYISYNQTELNLIQEAINDYSQYAQHIYMSEGIGEIGVPQIRQTVTDHISYTGKTPVIMIDYLQILAPYNTRSTDKQNMDKSIMELKRISRDYKTPVIGISSFNRANYKETVTMEAFKESGAIEYSSDVLIGLQLKGTGIQQFDINQAKQQDPRKIELIILKNRHGKTGDKIDFRYYPMFNYFVEEQKMEERK